MDERAGNGGKFSCLLKAFAKIDPIIDNYMKHGKKFKWQHGKSKTKLLFVLSNMLEEKYKPHYLSLLIFHWLQIKLQIMQKRNFLSLFEIRRCA